jgi:hypothetical protein
MDQIGDLKQNPLIAYEATATLRPSLKKSGGPGKENPVVHEDFAATT